MSTPSDTYATDSDATAPQKGEVDPRASAARWGKELEASDKEMQKFRATAKRLVLRYLDERDGSDGDVESDARFNLFWSNTEVLKSSLYAKPPNVDVSPAYKDSNDDVARVAGNMLQRILNNDVSDEDDDATYPDVTKQAVGDYLVVGLGQVWYRYDVETAQATTPPVTDPMTGTVLAPAAPYEAIVHEDAVADYVYWEDFSWSPARVWQEVRWVARRCFMGREQLRKRFGAKIGDAVPIAPTGGKSRTNDSVGPVRDIWDKAAVYEIWCITDKRVYWYVKGMDTVLDEQDDPLKLKNFFPCPMPLVANLTTSRFMPRADYLFAQDQYRQVDEITTRLKYLTRACKVVGAYDKTSTGLARIFTEGLENQMIPVDNWAGFAEKGGIKGSMDFVPLEVVANTIIRLTEQREVAKANLYEVLGIGDIMRGVTDPDETLGAQQLKAQFGGNRLQFKQQAIGRWVAQGQRIRAQIICSKFQPETIASRSNIENSLDAPLAQPALAFLKSDDASKAYRISIESETMAMVDWAQERDSRTQFLTSVGTFVQAVTPLLEAQPQAAPAVLQILKWGLGGFRISKEVETVMDQAIAEASKPQPPAPPSPQEQADVEETQASTLQKRSTAVKNIAAAQATTMETDLMPMQAEADAQATLIKASQPPAPAPNGAAR